MKKPKWTSFTSQADYIAALARWAETPEGKAEEAEIHAHRDRLAREDEAERLREADAAVTAVEIPPRDLALIRSGKLTETQAVREMQATITVVVMLGNTGCGKTVAASQWVLGGKDGIPAIGNLFVKAARLARWDCYDNEEMDRLLSAPRLVIDDLGGEFMDQRGRFLSVLTEVIDVRLDRELPTVITSNLTHVEFRERYKERITDRINGEGGFTVLAGSSLRGSKR